MDQPNIAVIYRHMLHSIPGRCPHILRQPGSRPKRCGSNYSSYTETRNKTQAIKIRVSPTRNGIPRIHHQQRRSQSRPCQNDSHLGLESSYQQKGNPGIHGILQLLSTLHRRIQQNRKTSIRLDQERHPMEIGGQRTNRCWRTTTKAMLNPSVDILQTRETTPFWNQHIKICFSRAYCVSRMKTENGD